MEFHVGRQTQFPRARTVLPLPELETGSVLKTIWKNIELLAVKISSECCGAQNEDVPIQGSIRGVTNYAIPPRYGARDRGTFTEVVSWLGSLPDSFHSSYVSARTTPSFYYR